MNQQKERPNLAKLRENYMKYVRQNTNFSGTDNELEWAFLEFCQKKGVLDYLPKLDE